MNIQINSNYLNAFLISAVMALSEVRCARVWLRNTPYYNRFPGVYRRVQVCGVLTKVNTLFTPWKMCYNRTVNR